MDRVTLLRQGWCCTTIELRLRPGAAAAQVIEQGGGAGEPSRFKEGEAADRFGGIEVAAHQRLKAGAILLELLRDHGDHLRSAMAERPSPCSWGRTNQIQ